MTTQEIIAETELEFAGRIRMLAEKMRIACGNHVKRKEDSPLAQRVLESTQVTEDIIEAEMQKWVKTHPVWTTWGKDVRDLGPMGLSALMARCLAVVRPIWLCQAGHEDCHDGCAKGRWKRLDTISQLWAHCGFAPGQRKVKGEKLNFDYTARVLAYRIGQRFVRTKKPGLFNAEYYKRKVYETARVEAAGGKVVHLVRGKKGRVAEDEEEEGAVYHARVSGKLPDPPDVAAGEVAGRSMRYMIKVFLACLWIVWRRAEGLEVREPYSAQYPGSDGATHHGYDPFKFVEVAGPHEGSGHPEVGE
jgi:hypothetical protein